MLVATANRHRLWRNLEIKKNQWEVGTFIGSLLIGSEECFGSFDWLESLSADCWLILSNVSKFCELPLVFNDLLNSTPFPSNPPSMPPSFPTLPFYPPLHPPFPPNPPSTPPYFTALKILIIFWMIMRLFLFLLQNTHNQQSSTSVWPNENKG